MAAAVVSEGVPNTHGETGTLFQGQKFWFSAAVPQRKWLIENVIANGGEVVPLEKQADILLVDHAKSNPAPGTHSYKYVDLSIRRGRLENLDDHVVGGTSRADRPVGSATLAPKASRNPYTEADDQFLWNWIKPLEDARAATAGNAIYKQLEAANPRHTFQSWRDRWLKYVRHQNRQATTHGHQQGPLQSTPTRQRMQPRPEDGAEGSPGRSRAGGDLQAPRQVQRRPRQRSVEVVIPRRNRSPDRGSELPVLHSRGQARSRRNTEYEKSGKSIFTRDIYDELFAAASHILIIPPELVSDAWAALARQKETDATEEQEKAKQEGKISKPISVPPSEEWRAYFELVIGPDYQEQLEEQTGKRIEDYLAKEQAPQASLTIQKTMAENGESPSRNDGHKSSIFSQPDPPILTTSQPEFATLSFSTTQTRAPGPNEARKRRTGKGLDSQESTSSTATAVDSIEELSQRSTQSQKRKRAIETDEDEGDSPSLPPFGNQEQAKRRRRSKEAPVILEIPSTPEQDAASRVDGSTEQQDPSQEAESPTPRPRHFAHKRSGRDSSSPSPLFVPQDHTSSSRRWSSEADQDRSSPHMGAERDEKLPSTRRRRERADQDTQTSPLSLHLVSDQDPPAGSSFSQAPGEEHDNGSPTPEFETAPEFSQIWETAPGDAAAAGENIQPSRDGTIAETQLEDEFALPEPEGGWDDLPLPPEADEEVTVGEAESHDGDDASAEAESIDAWVTAHLQADPDADDELLVKAAAIADLDFKLADFVYLCLVQGTPVPEDMKGVWTERDDMALRSNDPDEIKRVEEKHGKDSLAGRWQWLENELK